MGPRVRRIAILAVAFAALSPGAFGQSTKSGDAAAIPSADALPKHPIPYKALKTIGAKPKPKPKAAATPDVPGGPAAKPGAPPPTPSAKPPGAPSSITTSTKPASGAAPAVKPAVPGTAAPAAKSLAPLAAAPGSPKNTPAPPQPTPRPARPAALVVAPPPPLPAPQIGARLQPGQPLPVPELEAFIDGQVFQAMANDHIAGVAVAVVQNGQLVVEKGYGSSSPSPARKIDPRTTLVRLGTGSQIFTWIAALKAVEDGKLKLDAPVNGYLPEALKLPDEGFDRPILFRHLMSHTGGFEDRALGRRYVLDAQKLAPLDEALRRLRPRRVRAPGLVSIPSDYGVALAGDIVARLEGQPFDQLIETEVLKPLGLSHTSFREPYPAAPNLPDPMSQSLADAAANGFHWTGAGFEPQSFAYGQSLAPALSASSTVDDMARLMIALLNNGRMDETTLYSAKMAALLRTPLQRPAPGLDGWAHGLAMRRLPGGFEALSESGAAPAYRSTVALVPGLNLGVFVVANTDTGGALAQALPGAVVQRFYASQKAATTPNATQDIDYSGAYLSASRAYHGLEAFADRLTLQSEVTTDGSGALALRQGGGARLFSPTRTAGQFQSEDGEELFTPVANGRAQAYVFGSGGGAAERVGGVHSRTVLGFWAAAALLTVLASFAGLFIRDRVDPRETRAQMIANVTQVVTCVVWCLAFAAFALFAESGLSRSALMFDWPNRWLVVASWSALLAGVLSVLMVTQLPGAWREERRIHGWSIWRKLRHTGTVIVFLVFTGVLAAWGALEPWSS